MYFNWIIQMMKKRIRENHMSARLRCGWMGGGNIKITWKSEAKVAGGRHETNLPGFISRPSVLGCSVNTFPYEFMCPGRIPARGRENKVQTVVMWLWRDQSADPITLPLLQKTHRKTPQATAYSAPDWGPSGADWDNSRRPKLPAAPPAAEGKEKGSLCA